MFGTHLASLCTAGTVGTHGSRCAHKAVRALAYHDAVGSRRDEVVRAAVDAGLSKSEVHRLTGMARTAIDRIAGTLPAMDADPR